ncbi:MAG TPA: hypothetical protein PKA60_00045 [Candidatus Paceibacterota bacterium]|nr:hypothetical protein [Candidatus Paceibacterota bacterium]
MKLKLFFYIAFVVVIFFSTTSDAFAATYYWVGTEGGNVSVKENWNTAAAACSGTGNAPSVLTGDIFIFTSSCTTSPSINANWNIAGLTMQSGYSGTISIGSNTLNSTGSITISAGTFNLNSGTIIFSGQTTKTLTISDPSYFNAGTGTVTVNGRNITFNTNNVDFYNLTTSQESGSYSLTITSGTSINVLNNLDLGVGGVGLGTINAKGNVSHITGSSTTNTATININGTSAQSVVFNGGTASNVTINNSNATVAYNGTTTFRALTISAMSGSINLGSHNMSVQSLTQSAGGINVGSGTFTSTGAVNISGGTFNTSENNSGDFIATSTFTISGGTFHTTSGNNTFNHDFTQSGGTINASLGTIILTGAHRTIDVLNDLEINNLTISHIISNNRTIASGDVLVVNGNLILDSGRVTGNITAKGNVTVNSNFVSTTGTVTLESNGTSDAKSAIFNGGTAPGMVFNNPHITASFTASSTINSITMSTGTLNINSHNLSVNAAFTQSGGNFNTSENNSGDFSVTGVFTISGGTFHTTSGNNTFNNNFIQTGGTINALLGTVTFTGGSSVGRSLDILEVIVVNNLVINHENQGRRETASGDKIIVNGNAALIRGTLSGIVELKGDLVIGPVWNGTNVFNTATYSFVGTNPQSISNSLSDSFTSGQVTISNGSEVSLTSNAIITNFNIADGGIFNIGQYNFTSTTFAIDSGGTLVLTGEGTVTTPTIASGSTIRYTGSGDLFIKHSWEYQNLEIVGNSSNTAYFTAGQTVTISGNTTMRGEADSLLHLRSTIEGEQWGINPQEDRDIQYVNVKDSNNINITVIEATDSEDAGNNIGWNLSILAPQLIRITASGRHVTNISLESGDIVDQYIGGVFSLFQEDGASTIESITLTQVGSLSGEYLSDIKIEYFEIGGSDFCATEVPEGTSTFGTLGGVVGAQNIMEITTAEPLEFGNNNRLCFYIFYSIETGTEPDIFFAGKSIKFQITDADSIVLVGEEEELPEISLGSTPLSIPGFTIISQSGVSTLTLRNSEGVTIFFVDEGVLYRQNNSNEKRRITSKDIVVDAVVFKHLNSSKPDEPANIQIELLLSHRNTNYSGAPIRQYFKTTVTMRR